MVSAGPHGRAAALLVAASLAMLAAAGVRADERNRASFAVAPVSFAFSPPVSCCPPPSDVGGALFLDWEHVDSFERGYTHALAMGGHVGLFQHGALSSGVLALSAGYSLTHAGYHLELVAYVGLAAGEHRPQALPAAAFFGASLGGRLRLGWHVTEESMVVIGAESTGILAVEVQPVIVSATVGYAVEWWP